MDACISCSIVFNSLQPHRVACQAPLSVGFIFQVRVLEWVAIPAPGDLPDPGIKPASPSLQAHSLPPEPSGKPINTDIYGCTL